MSDQWSCVLLSAIHSLIMDTKFTIAPSRILLFALVCLACMVTAYAATPSLTIDVSKVRVTLNLAVGAKYQLLATKDMENWTPVGEPFLAQTGQQVLELDVAEVGRFFQIQQIDEPSAMFVPAGFVRIPAGTYVMGSPETEKRRWDDETQHSVTISHDFYMSKYEVTQKEYLAVMGNNPSYLTTKDSHGVPISPDLNRPVETVYWFYAMSYCEKVTAAEQAAGRLPVGWEYRLPTEAEWEYACRAGTSTPFHYGNDLRSGMANFDGRYEYVGGTGYVTNPNGTFLALTTAVGSYAPNAFGLYDMHGNVAEWCLDWYDSYPDGSGNDPRGPSTSLYRVFRGGGWRYGVMSSRSADRGSYLPVGRNLDVGFRPVLATAQ
jgi:formylglycine-generating enzyme required for sulfatase activity